MGVAIYGIINRAVDQVHFSLDEIIAVGLRIVAHDLVIMNFAPSRGHSPLRIELVFHKAVTISVAVGETSNQGATLGEANSVNFKSTSNPSPGATALEFFAGIGLARAGLERAGVEVVWATDYSYNKKAMYANQWGSDHFELSNVHDLRGQDLPEADIAWASSPCTDLSLAGARVGLHGGKESSAFFGFTRVIAEMGNRKPPILVLENVTGLASSNGGNDLRSAIIAFNELGYAADVIVLDGRRWVPQSRPRLFLVGAAGHVLRDSDDGEVRPENVSWIHRESDLVTFKMPLPPPPALVNDGLSDLVERLPESDDRWWEPEKVQAFIDSMSMVQRNRLLSLVDSDQVSARTAYRRTRKGVPTWEMRADDISGCLRTARGGSSRQAVVVAGQGGVGIRWMTSVEYARLMGAANFNLAGISSSQAHYGFGDAVVVPAVTWLAKNMLVPLLDIDSFERELMASD